MTWLYAHTFVTPDGAATFTFIVCVFGATYAVQRVWRDEGDKRRARRQRERLGRRR